MSLSVLLIPLKFGLARIAYQWSIKIAQIAMYMIDKKIKNTFAGATSIATPIAATVTKTINDAAGVRTSTIFVGLGTVKNHNCSNAKK